MKLHGTRPWYHDDNGNRTNTGYATGDHNRLTADGTYTYGYDNEGNVTSNTDTSTSESVEVQPFQGWRGGWVAAN